MLEFLPQFQIALLFSLDNDIPSYLRVLLGAINSVTSLKRTVEETGISDAVLLADTGFYFLSNITALESMKLSYIIPLRRNSRPIDYSFVGERNFMFQDHPIFYPRYERSSRTVYTFRNDFLKAEEEKDYISRQGGNVRFGSIRDRMVGQYLLLQT